MIKKSINLLETKSEYYKLEDKFRVFRHITVVFSSIFFVICLIFAFFLIQSNDRIAKAADIKKDLLKTLESKQKDEKNLLLLSKKLSQYRTFVAEDAKFIPYYNLLLGTIQSASSAGQLADFSIDKLRHVAFKLKFDSFEQLASSFKFIESNGFLQNFQQLSLANFFGINRPGLNNAYELSFQGIFKEINE